MKIAAIDQSCDNLAYVVTLAAIFRHDAQQIIGVIAWRDSRVYLPGHVFAAVEMRDNAAANR